MARHDTPKVSAASERRKHTMAEAAASDEVAELNAKIRDLEAQLTRQKRKKRDAEDDEDEISTSHFSDSVSDVKDSGFDAVTRVFRGLTMAAIEAARLTGDTVSTFAGDVIDRNERRDDGKRTVRHLACRLPEDFFDGLSNAVDDFARIPAKAADRYSSASKEGTKEVAGESTRESSRESTKGSTREGIRGT